MRDVRLGKRGEYKPALTISFQPYNRAHIRRGIGDGYYVVIDAFPSVDVDAAIEELKGIIADGLSGASDQTDDAQRTDISDVPVPDGESG